MTLFETQNDKINDEMLVLNSWRPILCPFAWWFGHVALSPICWMVMDDKHVLCIVTMTFMLSLTELTYESYYFYGLYRIYSSLSCLSNICSIR